MTRLEEAQAETRAAQTALERDRSEHAIRLAVIADGFGDKLGITSEQLITAFRAAMGE